MSCFTNRSTVTIFQVFSIILLQERVEGFVFLRKGILHCECTSAKHFANIKTLYSFHYDCSCFVRWKRYKNIRPEYISQGKHQQEQEPLFIRPLCLEAVGCGAFHVQEVCTSADAYCFHDSNLFCQSGATKSCVMEWRLIDKNRRKDTFQFLMFLRDAAHKSTADRPQWIPIALGVGRGTCSALQWNPTSLPGVLSASLCLVSVSGFCILHCFSEDFLIIFQL